MFEETLHSCFGPHPCLTRCCAKRRPTGGSWPRSGPPAPRPLVSFHRFMPLSATRKVRRRGLCHASCTSHGRRIVCPFVLCNGTLHPGLHVALALDCTRTPRMHWVAAKLQPCGTVRRGGRFAVGGAGDAARGRALLLLLRPLQQGASSDSMVCKLNLKHKERC